MNVKGSRPCIGIGFETESLLPARMTCYDTMFGTMTGFNYVFTKVGQRQLRFLRARALPRALRQSQTSAKVKTRFWSTWRGYVVRDRLRRPWIAFAMELFDVPTRSTIRGRVFGVDRVIYSGINHKAPLDTFEP